MLAKSSGEGGSFSCIEPSLANDFERSDLVENGSILGDMLSCGLNRGDPRVKSSSLACILLVVKRRAIIYQIKKPGGLGGPVMFQRLCVPQKQM